MLAVGDDELDMEDDELTHTKSHQPEVAEDDTAQEVLGTPVQCP